MQDCVNSIFRSSDRNYECVLDMEGQAVQDEDIITQYIDTATSGK